MLYFDHNATSPMLPEAKEAWLEAAEDLTGNPSSSHRLGARADAAMEQARVSLAAILGCSPLDIVWTSGATESSNMVFHHLARTLGPETEVWVTSIEHPCVLEAARAHFPKTHHFIPIEAHGVINLDWLSEALDDRRPGLVACMAANNETGIIQPWQKILHLCQSQEVPFFCDAVQWIGKLPADGLGACDFLCGGAHKFGGPRGVGFLKMPSQGLLRPLLRGGPQEQGMRAGTENLPGIISMLAALYHREAQIRERMHETRLSWRQEFEEELPGLLRETRLTGGDDPERLWNTVSAIMPETDCRHRWIVKLDKSGAAVSTGSACSSGQEKSSHVLSAMNIPPEEASRVLRFSSGWETRREDWHNLLSLLNDVYLQIRK